MPRTPAPPEAHDYRLTTTVRNAVRQQIEEIGLNPREFKLEDVARESAYGTYVLSRVTHVESGFWFLFGAGAQGLYVDFSPPRPDGSRYRSSYNQADQLSALREWLRVVKREHEAVDLWAALREESRLIVGDVVDEGNEKFTAAEVAVVRLRLDEVKRYLLEQAPNATPAQINNVTVTFNHVADTAERLTKKEWKGILVSAIIAQAFTLALSPQAIHGLLTTAANLILPLLGPVQVPPLPPLP
jgi:hypothetical protein